MTTSESSKQINKIEPFLSTLDHNGLKLERKKTTTLQINVGYECNQTCLHCHLDAGPGRRERMDRSTMEAVILYAGRSRFETVDITGGAPELNPLTAELIERMEPLCPRIMLRSNISVLNDGKKDHLIDFMRKHRVVIVASFPSLNEAQSEAQRGEGSFHSVIEGLQKLNKVGYGQEGRGLELNLVSNPTGAFLSPSQAQQEKRFRQVLERKWGIVFNNLFNFANVPLGRFYRWLVSSGNYEKYMDQLVSGFNPCAMDGLMCRSLVSVSWDGYLFDCDFNQAKELFMGGKKIHVSEMSGPPEEGSPIAVGDHCYTCTAGAGFT